ncbi:MAG: PAS domain-containing protein [Candidatus Saliniplasma sp.]
MRTSCSYNVKILEVGLMGYELRDVIQNGIIEELPVQVMLLNEEREIEWANQEILDYTDLEYDKIMGKTCFEIFHDRKEPCEECFINGSKKQKKLSFF